MNEGNDVSVPDFSFEYNVCQVIASLLDEVTDASQINGTAFFDCFPATALQFMWLSVQQKGVLDINSLRLLKMQSCGNVDI